MKFLLSFPNFCSPSINFCYSFSVQNCFGIFQGYAPYPCAVQLSLCATIFVVVRRYYKYRSFSQFLSRLMPGFTFSWYCYCCCCESISLCYFSIERVFGSLSANSDKNSKFSQRVSNFLIEMINGNKKSNCLIDTLRPNRTPAHTSF